MTQRHLAGLATAWVLAVGIATAQTAQQAQPPAAPVEAAKPSRPPEPVGMTNIKLDLTITDQGGQGDALRKTVTMVVADRGNGSIRSGGNVRGQGRVHINVDASPSILQNGTIRLRLALEYSPRSPSADGPAESSTLNEVITVVLDSNKPMVVSQAADPASDRRISVEVRAALLK